VIPGQPRVASVPWWLAGVFAMAALGTFAMGLWLTWAANNDVDMQARMAEYAAFRVGDYPNRNLDVPMHNRALLWSVYPPYAFPMFAVFFEPGGLRQGRLLILVCTIASVWLMGLYGRERLKPFGPAWAAVGALAGAGISSNGTTIGWGQFSTMCTGMLVLQLILIERGRFTAAGVAWAGAMIKPQIALASAALFLAHRMGRGLVVGITLLAALSAAAIWWTDISFRAVAEHWLFRVPLTFALSSKAIGPAHVAAWLGWNQRVMQYAALGMLALIAVTVFRRLPRDLSRLDLLPWAALCAVLGRVLIYHRHYDDVMLFPLLLACLSLGLTTPTAANVAMAVSVGVTLVVPMRVLSWMPFAEVILPTIWVIAALWVCREALARARRQVGDAGRAHPGAAC
jgi:hypothetical protein